MSSDIVNIFMQSMTMCTLEDETFLFFLG